MNEFLRKFDTQLEVFLGIFWEFFIFLNLNLNFEFGPVPAQTETRPDQFDR